MAATGTAAVAIGMAVAVTGAAIADVGTAVAVGAGAPQASPLASRSARGGLITAMAMAMAMVIPMEAMPTAIPITQRPLMAAAAWYGALITPRMERS